MKKIILLSVLLAGFAAGSVHAGGAAQSGLGCSEVLESWAIDPDSMSKARVDECKGIKGIVDADEDFPAIVPFAGAAAAQAADPCAGPNAGSSVHCWGPWSALAPAAGAAIGPQILIPADEYPLRPELIGIDPDVGSCEPGTPCGFATVVDGASTEAPGDETAVAEFDLATDGSSFVVGAGTSGEIASVTDMTTDFTDRPDGLENMEALGVDGDHASLLVARVLRKADGELTGAADIWIDGDTVTGAAKSGYFAWGISMTQGDLDFLKGNGVSVAYSGRMSVDNNTVATVAANFGSQTTWAGTWTNPGYTFDAGGSFVGVDMLSDASQFSSNVAADGFVRGALFGQRDNSSIAHVIDVDLAGVGRVRDVGILLD